MSRTHVVITVHGIRTFGHWQARLGKLIIEKEPDAVVYHYVYGYFSMIAFLIPPLRWLVTRRFRNQLSRISRAHPNARIDLVGHSFGTHLIGWGLQRMQSNLAPDVHTVILSGSVLRSSFDWSRLLIKSAKVHRVVNDCGIHDNILVINQIAVLFTGMAGRIGLIGMTGPRFCNRFFSGGHSLYFEKDGYASDDFMVRYWLPLLCTSLPVEVVDQRSAPTWYGGLMTTVLQNSEPIKLTVYGGLALLPAIIFYNLYKESALSRARLEEQLALTLKAQNSEQLAQSRVKEAREEALRRAVWTFNEYVRFPEDQYTIPAYQRQASREVLQSIKSSGFSGRLSLEGHRGRFIVIKSSGLTAQDSCISWTKPRKMKDINFTEGGREYHLALGQKLAEAVRREAHGLGFEDRQTEAVSFGVEAPAEPYPFEYSSNRRLSREDCLAWNNVALRNNRVTIVLKH